MANAIKFSELSMNARFIFESEQTMPHSGMMRGPWIRQSKFHYIHADQEKSDKPTIYRVGSSSVKVIAFPDGWDLID